MIDVKTLRKFRSTAFGVRACVLSCALGWVLGSASMVGCAASGRSATPDAEMDPSARLAEAHRLAELAQQSAEGSKRASASGNEEKATLERRRAIEYYGRAVTLHDSMGAAWNNLGVLLIEEGRYMDASRALQRAAAISPTDPRPHDNLGLIYHLTGYDEQALRHYTDALELDPQYLNSLRGGVLAASRLSVVNEDIVGWAERGMLIDTDPRWREIFMRERLQFAAMLEEKQGRQSGR